MEVLNVDKNSGYRSRMHKCPSTFKLGLQGDITKIGHWYTGVPRRGSSTITHKYEIGEQTKL